MLPQLVNTVPTSLFPLPTAGGCLVVPLLMLSLRRFLMNLIPQPAASQLLPYAQASVVQREQLLAYLRRRLPHHFPTLSLAAWLRALFEFQPTLVLSESEGVTLDAEELKQLVQHLNSSSELPLLDPPVYGLTTLDVAQHYLRAIELAVMVLPELIPSHTGPRLLALLTYLCQPYSLAEQVVQAWRWDLSSSPPLPKGLPGGGPIPGSEEVQRYLAQLGRVPAI